MSTTKSPDVLTPKQREVYDLLDKGVAIEDIAKRMKVGKPSVYQHMRKIREAGVTLPTEQLAANGGSAQASSNGARDNNVVTSLIAEHANKASLAIEAIDDELATMQRRLEELKAAREAAESQLARHERALSAYA